MEILEQLVATPSWSVPAQDREGRQKCDEGTILDIIQDYFKGTDVQLHRVGQRHGFEHRRSVVVVKGSQDAAFTLGLYAHVDTVYPDGFPKEWNNPLHLESNGDRLSGLGAYDMKAGVMTMIDILREVEVPKGIRVVGAFCPDEEGNSFGAIDVVNWLGANNMMPDLVLSPEIATLRNSKNRPERDDPKDVVVNRVGHVKSILKLTAPQMHGFEGNGVDAFKELRVLMDSMEKRMANSARTHKNFGSQPERLQFKQALVERAEGFSNTTKAFLRLSYMNFPGNSSVDVLEWQRRCIANVASRRAWTANRVAFTFDQTPGETTYQPYALDVTTPVAQAVLGGVDDVYGAHKLKAGHSTSDANVWVAAGVPTFDIGAMGGKAHHREEWVSGQSIKQNIEFYRNMITRRIPDLLAARK